MKFTDGYWLYRNGWSVLHPRTIQRIEKIERGIRIYAPTSYLVERGDEVGATILTISITAVAEGIVKTKIEHFYGYLNPQPVFDIAQDQAPNYSVRIVGTEGVLASGDLRVKIGSSDGFRIEYYRGDELLTASIPRSTGLAVSPKGEKFLHEQLLVQPNEFVYGLGERFGPTIKNGQHIEMWNADGGTATQQAYKNVPFYLTNRNYGVLVNHPEKVEYEVCSEINSRVQFSVPGDSLEYFVITGADPKDVIKRYTDLTGKPPHVPEWSYGLWLSTSFRTDYSEETVTGFLDEMDKLGIPVSVLHLDCYWMRPSHWCDLVWDPEKFPDPDRMLRNYHERGIKVCVWINPYLGQQSDVWSEAKVKGYLLKATDGSVRQWDHWQSGLSWIDFTNPEATEWWKSKLKELLRQGVDCFKTDFGERVPTDVIWHDGSDPMRMHNYYTYLYNRAAYEAIAEERGEQEALVFARSATVGSQTLPVHWGGDSEPTFVSMAETLRGGLGFGLTGFPYWSHDMGGFEGQPDPVLFSRWFAFGMFSSHSRLHGSNSYRVPWIYGEDAVRVAKKFTQIKRMLLPYLRQLENDATELSIPFIRHMILEFPNDLGSATVDTQYMFGPNILVAPVFNNAGDADVYLPTAGWTSLLTGERYEERGWFRQQYAIDVLPLLVPDGAVIPLLLEDGRKVLALFAPQDGETEITVEWKEGEREKIVLQVFGENVDVTSPDCGVAALAIYNASSNELVDSTTNELLPLAAPKIWKTLK
ncbi:alpha-xylosidase [Trueperella pyogenes]|uniref:alpha-xylosidase n=1 Tax=Trueperella pyogenes TaxID=1661 RepID=UPI003132D960